MNITRPMQFLMHGIVIGVLITLTYFVIEQRATLKQLIDQNHHAQEVPENGKTGDESALQEQGELVAPTIIEKVVTKNELWRPIQEKVRDTVVQVFSHIARFDLLQPYKTPAQSSACGSAFFIDDAGHLVTNAHVINQANAIWIQVPSLGKRIIDVELVGLSPDRDIALLKLPDHEVELIRAKLGKVPHLPLGDSDSVRRADEVMALGYPLGQQSLKSTTGVISGREHSLFQMSAAINPGNSGGPLINVHGEVIGINSSGVLEAQNVGYMIPINDFKNISQDLHTTKLLRKPFLGILFNNATETLTEFLNNPQPGGCYVVEVVNNSPLAKAGVKSGDMLYEINGHRIDEFGEMSVPWGEDKISVMDYVSRLSIDDDVHLVTYRSGKKRSISVKFSQTELPGIRKIYPGYEDIDYEVFGGMVVMSLTINHIQLMAESIPGILRYAELANQSDPALVITHIFSDSQLARSRTITPGATLKEVNGVAVKTLAQLRDALLNNTKRFITIKAVDNVSRASENVFVALPTEKVIQEEPRLARTYHYAITQMGQAMIQKHSTTTNKQEERRDAPQCTLQTPSNLPLQQPLMLGHKGNS